MHTIFGAPHMYLTVLCTVYNTSHCLQRIQRLLFRWIFYGACDGSIGGRRRFKQIIQCAVIPSVMRDLEKIARIDLFLFEHILNPLFFNIAGKQKPIAL